MWLLLINDRPYGWFETLKEAQDTAWGFHTLGYITEIKWDGE